MKAYIKNTDGDFYVEDSVCLLCLEPERVAPGLITSDNKSCYFYRQPESENEINQALEAMSHSCCSGLIYKGSNPEIIKKAKENSNIEPSCIING